MATVCSHKAHTARSRRIVKDGSGSASIVLVRAETKLLPILCNALMKECLIIENTIFNGIAKATHVRSRAVYRLKIIARARSINHEFLGFVYALVATL